MDSDATLATERLTLRPCEIEDTDGLHRLWTDPDVRRFLWDDRVIDRAEAQAVVVASCDSFVAQGFGQWVVETRTGDGGLAGFCGLRAIGDGPEIELLYGLLPAHWGRGLAYEAAIAVLTHGFEAVGLPSIEGRVDTPNRRSTKVLERLGMRALGERLVDGLPTLRYTLSREAFRAAHPREPLS